MRPHPHPEVWALVGLLVGAYLGAVRWAGPRHVEPWERAVSRRQAVCFGLGVAALWVAADWPVHELAENYLLFVHMVQHLLISLVAPPLLLLGTPTWLFRLLVRPVLPQLRAAARPLVALVLFNGVVAVTHWPRLVSLSLTSEGAHLALHAVLFASATLMWLPVLSPVMEIPRLSYPGQILYLFAQSIVPTVPASFLTFASRPIYRLYAEAPRIAGIGPVDDQRIAGLIMKLAGGLILWGVIAVLFFRWFGAEEREGIDALAYRDVDRDLNRVSR